MFQILKVIFIKCYKKQLPVQSWLAVLHQLLHQHLYIILQIFWNLFNIIWKRIFKNFHRFSWIHPKSLTPLLNDQNKLSVTRALYRKLGQCHILAKNDKFFFKKKDTNNFTIPDSISISFLSVLLKNKALYNFNKRGQQSHCLLHKSSRFNSGDKRFLSISSRNLSASI